jgi:hypothetical protein
MRQPSRILVIILFISLFASPVFAQCSVCTKTASQMGEKPAKGMNSAILYLMAMPFVVGGYIAYRWWKSNKD